MSVKSTNSLRGHEYIIKAGYLKKLKTSKKKFFVLYVEGPESSARLEYYDSEKKFNNGHSAKRSIPIKPCFNINKRSDTKHKHVIALYTKDDCFCIVLENEEELDEWLKALLSLQQGEEVVDGETPRPTFEHVWQVTILNRGLGATSIMGAYSKGHEAPIFRLCLTDKTLSFIRKDQNTPQTELSLSSIRSCGSLKNYVYLEIGRSSVTGSGELWMETEDSNIAQNVHETIFHAMTTTTSSSSSSKEELAPKSRYRSSSATEASKPAGRKQIYSGCSKHHSQDVNSQIIESPVPASTSSTNIAGSAVASRERCDSMPSRARTSSEGTHPINTWIQSRAYLTARRPQSLHVRDISHSPPVESPMSPTSAACSTDSAGSSLSIDDPDQWCEADTVLSRYSHSLTPDEAIAEENYDDWVDSPGVQPISSDDGYVDMSPRTGYTTISPAASFCSVTSGTPSTDMRFTDYHLEKVSAYFLPSEDDQRPIRAYSVGSRPDIILNKTNLATENARVRAFSVGSKSKKFNLQRFLPSHGNLMHPQPKSSSAPLLTGSRTPLNHNADLMEMDFSKPSTSGYMDMSSGNKGYMDMSSGNKGYMEMSSGNKGYMEMGTGNKGYMEMGSGNKGYMEMGSGNKGYMEMRPGLPLTPIATPPDYLCMQPGLKIVTSKPLSQEYVDMNMSKHKKVFSTSPKYPSIESTTEVSSDYVDMDCHQSSKPNSRDGYVEMTLGRSTHQRQSSLENNDYTTMSMGSKKTSRKDTQSQPITIQTTSTTSSLSNQFPKGSSSISPVYSSLHIGRKYSAGTYMPNIKNTNTNSYSSLPRERSRKNSRNDSRDSSSSSVTTPSSSSIQFPLSLNSPGSPLKSQVAHKPPEALATGTIKVPQAVMNVKYNNRSSGDYTAMDFPRPRDYVNYTPSVSKGSLTQSSSYDDYLFLKPKSELTKRNGSEGDYAVMKPGIDFSDKASTQVKSDSGDYALMKPLNSSGDYAVMRPLQNSGDYADKQPPQNSGDYAVMQPLQNSDDYAVMQPLQNSGDYAVMRPLQINGEHAVMKPLQNNGDYAVMKPLQNNGEYAIMRPGSLDITRNTTALSSASLTTQLSSMALGRTGSDLSAARCFIPISESRDVSSPRVGGLANNKSQEESVYECMSPVAKTSRPNSVNSDKRPNSTSSELGSSSSTLVGSRPASVNSDTMRPASVTIEGQLHYASLDLAPTTEEDCNRSPRTSKSDVNNTSPTQTGPDSNVSGFTYAEIDFVKSDGFKNALSNTKVKH